MINYIWSFLIIISIIFSFFNGGISQMSQVITSGAQRGIELTITLCALMCFWSGIMEIANQSGLFNKLAHIITPITKRLFPDVNPSSPAMNAIVMNIAANLFGMGNAATPFGIKAMKELDKLNYNQKTASNAMCMFVVINTASLQLIPSTLIGIRAMCNSAAPEEIVVPVWMVSSIALIIGIISTKLLENTP